MDTISPLNDSVNAEHVHISRKTNQPNISNAIVILLRYKALDFDARFLMKFTMAIQG